MIYENGTSKITGKQFVSKTEEMRIQQNHHGILGTNYQRRTAINRPSQTKRDQRMASTNYSQTSQGLLRIWKFLSMLQKFSELALPLNNLLKKDTQFDWTLACQESFNTFKKRFTEEPVLMRPDHSRTFQIESDASKYASGAVMTQMDSNGDRHPVAFMSKMFNDTKKYMKYMIENYWE